MNLPNFGAKVDFCPTLCRANIVLTMAMSRGGTVEGVQQRSHILASQRGVQMDSGFSGLRGIA